MKNIHLIATDQPSRLAFDIDDEFYLLSEDPVFFKHQNEVENRNIYITSYEEIKEGDWCIDLDTDNVFRLGNWTTGRVVKIILTTAPTLIADGVQGIYDEFLEWFVKNPTCEFVEVKHKDIIQYGNMTMKDVNGDGSYYFCTNCGDLEVSRSKQEVLKFGVEYYKIIIPQKEPKQEYQSECICENSCRGFVNVKCKQLQKQETLEEAAEKYSQGWGENDDVKSFIAGGDYMAKNMPIHILDVENTKVSIQEGIVIVEKNDKKLISYSEEEVVSILYSFHKEENSRVVFSLSGIAKWFEQFKKK